jgi:hypothetical protein
MLQENYIKKLQDFEAAPPAMLWSSIAAALDEADDAKLFAERMQQYSAPAPADSWNKIISQLNSSIKIENTAPVIKLSRFPKIAIAAALVAAVSIMLWLSDKKNIAASVSTVTNEEIENIAKQYEDKSLKQATTAINASEANNVIAANALNEVSKIMKPIKVHLPLQLNKQIAIHVKPNSSSAHAGITVNNILANKFQGYIPVQSPGGELTFVSPKLNLLASLLQNDNNVATSTDIEKWKLKLEDWKKKIACANILPATNNFFDILEFEKLISEN